VIEVEGRVVKIVRMGIRATMVKTRDNEEIILPNSTLSQSAVTNYTLDELACRVRLKVGVSYASDMSVVREALLESARALPDAIADREPEVLMADFGDHAVVFDLGVWISDPWRMRSIRAALAAVIWDTFADRGVTIAFQQLDLHLDPPVVDTLRALSGRAA
jgi:small-conductance mechanosensitive channel